MIEQLLSNEPMTGNMKSTGNSVADYVFVTGGSGLVGSNLIQRLITQGQRVKALYRSAIPDIPFKEKVTWVQGDILDIISLEEALVDVQYVYHCAAIVAFDPGSKNQMFKTNIEGTANVVNAAIEVGVQKLCFVSSVAAIGKSKVEINEAMSWSEEPDKSNYGKSKFYAEMEVWRGIGEGLKAVIVNPSIILGAGDWNDGSTKIFKTAYEEFKWYTEGVTGFVDIQDVTKAMTMLMASEISNSRFIISAENRTYKNVFTAIATAFGKKPPYKKATRFLSQMVLKAETIKSLFTGERPLLTPETAKAAQATVQYENAKLLNALPGFSYTPLNETIKRVSGELALKYNLSID